MVHEVTMDTVRIITSSVSGMTSVSWLAYGLMAQVCAVRGCEGRTAQAQDSALLLLPFPLPGRMGGPRAFSCLSSFFKIHFLGGTLLPSPGQCLAHSRPDTYHLTYCLKCIHHLKAPQSRGVCAHAHMYSLSYVRFIVAPWTGAHQAPLPIEFSRQEYWSGVPFPPPEDLPDPRTKPVFCIGRQILHHESRSGSPCIRMHVCMCVSVQTSDSRGYISQTLTSSSSV